jgi:putative ABC transport system permease protein
MKHQVKLAIGNLKKSSLTTILNLVGLTSAFAAFILIMLYVWNEHHFDCYNKNVNEIYRLEVKGPDDPKTQVFLMGLTGKTLTDELPEILASTIYMPWGKFREETFKWETLDGEVKSFEDYAYSDEKLTDIFSFTFSRGKRKNPLMEPQTAIVSESFARKAWGKDDPTGKQLKAGNSLYTVSAVFADLPENSVIRCPIILKLPSSGWLAEGAHEWGMTNYPQFILVRSGTDPKVLNERINSQSVIKSRYSFFNKGIVSAELVARPLHDLRFTTEVAETPMYTSNSRMFVISLFWVGILIILVALINYVNFATANLPRRIKSISITRIIGCSRGFTISVLVAETIVLFLGSFILAIAFSFLINEHSAAIVLGYALPYTENYRLLVAIGMGSLLFGVAAGLYPAFYCTSGKAVESLKRFNPNTRMNFRGALTVSQFAATIILIAASVLVIKQVKFMEGTNPGFNKKGTLVINMNDELRMNYEPFKNKLKSSSLIKDVAGSRAVPGQAQEMNSFVVEGKNCPVWYWAVDDNYIEMMGFTVTQGRNFLKDSNAENQSMICNEAAIRKYGWKLGDRIGGRVLVGILKDFNFISLRSEVEPFAFWYTGSTEPFGYISIKISSNNVSDAVAFIDQTFNSYSSDIPFRYFFLDDHLNMLYSKENQQVKLVTTFSLLSVIVSVLGILGLSIFMCQYRIKEIGIRKVNGAKISEVMTMLNKDFVKWVAIAFVMATPIAWYAMHRWLENFAYKTPLSWWIFALAGFLAIGSALLTVSWQSWKAATRNPVEALRYE